MSDESFTEQVEAEVTPPERPEGAPALVPFKAVPRRRRADMMRALEGVQDAKKRLDKVRAANKGSLKEPAVAAAVFDLIAECEDVLVPAAADEAAFREWATTAGDDELTALFGWYVSRFQVGE